MAERRERLEVATCIACGARSRVGDCADGCTDVPLDLVSAAEVDAAVARVAALEARADAFASVLQAAMAEGEPDWNELRSAARSALRLRLPDPQPEPEVVQAWGCPECGRVDAPQPCLDVCIRRPVLMADAAEYRALEPRASTAAERERRLRAPVRLLAYVAPRRGEEARTHKGLRAAARAAFG
jgi:hypothetical protein